MRPAIVYNISLHTRSLASLRLVDYLIVGEGFIAGAPNQGERENEEEWP